MEPVTVASVLCADEDSSLADDSDHEYCASCTKLTHGEYLVQMMRCLMLAKKGFVC
jgi:hypothetical protein